MDSIGLIKEIYRYPVKSFHGESVAKSKVQDYGLYGDRSHVFIDEARRKKYLMATYIPEMLAYKAQFEGEEKDDQFPRVKIAAPDGREFYWDDDECLEEMKTLSGQSHIYQKVFSPGHVPIGAIEEEHILLVNEASLRKLEEMWGKQVDFRRFRPNLVISLHDDTPFLEDTLFGKQIKIGDVILEIKRHCERCNIINIHPDTMEMEKTLLKTVVRERNNYFGVYATVVQTGEVHTGDEIVLI
ncbi:MOSC domain-containing protein [Bacillus sp. V59.32b]|uniref:MOSC domain-containing protein n=1 Tax=Bacillus sp. V59.32b TaxID=1758642 RepID=UPI0020B154E2|nr:MOSC domain-containing protein [Bacillus sp. V59.32b]